MILLVVYDKQLDTWQGKGISVALEDDKSLANDGVWEDFTLDLIHGRQTKVFVKLPKGMPIEIDNITTHDGIKHLKQKVENKKSIPTKKPSINIWWFMILFEYEWVILTSLNVC